MDEMMAQFVEFQKFKLIMSASPKPSMASLVEAEPYQPSWSSVIENDNTRTFNLAIYIRKLIMGLRLINEHEHSHVLALIQLVLKNDPSRLHDFHDLHNSADGTKTYYSVRFKVHETFSYAIHIYGIKRYGFNVSSVDVLIRSGLAPITIPVK
jgi:hypothetical protein